MVNCSIRWTCELEKPLNERTASRIENQPGGMDEEIEERRDIIPLLLRHRTLIGRETIVEYQLK